MKKLSENKYSAKRTHRFGIVLATALSLINVTGHANEQEYIPGEFVISESNEILQDKALTLLDEATSKPLAITDSSKVGIRVETPEGYDPSASNLDNENICTKLKEVERQKQVEGHINRRFYRKCERNGLFHAELTANDAYYSSMWALQRLNMTSVWDRSTGSNDVVVAIVDTGVNYNHPDLAQNMWVNTGEIPGNGIDDDGDGYVDDIYGYNAIAASGDPMDDNGHGTHVAGTIGARTNNGIGVAGINWNVKIMATKFLSSSGSGSLWDAINALHYIRVMKQRGVNVILSNNSWGGGGYYSALYNEIQAAKNDGILFVAAAGNSTINSDANPQYPAAYDLDNIISVAAIDQSGALASYSNYGKTTVDLAAPGTNIASCWVDGSYRYLSGTSMATPHVSGALALMKAYSSGMTWTQLKQTLLSSTSPNANLTNKILTNGELNISLALQNIIPTTPTPAPTSTNTPLPTFTPTRTPTATITPVPATPTPTATPVPGSWRLRVLSDGVGLGQVAVTLTNNATSATTTGITGTDGTFNAAWLAGGSYTLALSKTGYAFGAGSTTVNINGATNTDLYAIQSLYTVKVVVLRKKDAVSVNSLPINLYVNGQIRSTINSDSNGVASFSVAYGAIYKLETTSADYYPEGVDGTVTGRVTRTIALTKN